jgi:outer membrane protein TolC
LEAIRLALDHRLDLGVAGGRVYDAQRGVTVAANDLGGRIDLTASVAAGERRSLLTASLPDSLLFRDRERRSALLELDLPLERTSERNAFRESYIALERSVRDFQELEDRIKLDVRTALRNLLEFREGLMIQAKAVRVAQRRVESTDLFLRAGRAEVRDLLDAQEDLLAARNALTAAQVNYRVAELGLQRDMGVLRVDERGLWKEYRPGRNGDERDQGFRED